MGDTQPVVVYLTVPGSVSVMLAVPGSVSLVLAVPGSVSAVLAVHGSVSEVLPPHLHSNGRHTTSGCLPHSSWVCLCSVSSSWVCLCGVSCSWVCLCGVTTPPPQQWEMHNQWLFTLQLLSISVAGVGSSSGVFLPRSRVLADR